MCLNYALYCPTILEHHLLMVTVTLCGSPGGDGPAHDDIDLYALSLFVSQIKQLSLLHQKVYVLFILYAVPVVPRLTRFFTILLRITSKRWNLFSFILKGRVERQGRKFDWVTFRWLRMYKFVRKVHFSSC